MGEEDPAVDEGRLAQIREQPAERRRVRRGRGARRGRSAAAAGRRSPCAARAPRRWPASAPAIRRSSQASPEADVRPATISSARGSAATARTAARRSVTRSADLRRGRARHAAEQDEVQRPVDVDAQPPAPAQVGHLVAGDLRQPARQGVVGRQVRDVPQNLRPGNGHDVRREAVVRERPQAIGRCGRDERPPVRRRRQRDRAGAQDDRRPSAGWLATNARRRAPNGDAVGRAGRSRSRRSRRRPGSRGGVVRPPSRAARATQRSSSPARGPGSGCRMSTATSDIQPSLPIRRQALTRRVRAYVGLGANSATRPRRSPRAIQSLAALPGARLRRVSRLYATVPVGVVDQPEFRNAVVSIDVPHGPDPATGALALLVGLKRLERAFGRRERERWGPRELDLDLLVFGRHRIDVERPAEARSTNPSDRRTSSFRIGSPGSGCSSSRRLPISRLASSRRAGARPSRRPAAAKRRSKARTRFGRSPAGLMEPGTRRSLEPAYSRTDGGRSRSNMWTVSMNRTCLDW